jgi:hypothetical protein
MRPQMKNKNKNDFNFLSSFFNELDPIFQRYFITWAVSYFSKKSPALAKAFEQYLESGSSDKLDKYLSKNNHKESFQNAWRQAKRRKFKKEQVTLHLNHSEYKTLQSSAIKNNMNMTQYLIKLINDNGLF